MKDSPGLSDVRVMPDESFDAMRPRIRSDALVRTYGEDILAWASVRQEPIVLDGVAGVVFRIIDGATTVSELLADVCDVVGVPRPIARAQLRAVLGQLAEAHLLDGLDRSVPPPSKVDLFPAPPNP